MHKKSHPDTLEPCPGLTSRACMSLQGLIKMIWSAPWSVLTYIHMGVGVPPAHVGRPLNGQARRAVERV